MSNTLEGKVAVVTGAATGIGAAIARRFAGEACRVVVADVDAAGAASRAAAIGGLGVAVDVAVEDQVRDLFQACDREYGRLDVLVNNAGATGPTASTETLDIAEWRALFAVNVEGVMLCAKYAVPLLKRQGGAIVNMSSLSGYRPLPYRTAYGASKFAVRGITESLAHELGRDGIRVNSLCPGGTNTALFRRNNQARADQEGITLDELIERDYRGGTALGILLEPENVADAALFLASDAASAITGEHLRIDAGKL
jgi:NAD(P)-dependent dehydrogenase (short-subunit alcohol dehydrogenase family)